ncbi:MAG: hypothetical protein IPG55_16420 [Saprospiraceae bacterium]|nr:hypothetical protein [Candidatus Defluviibacterium haderslevense]
MKDIKNGNLSEKEKEILVRKAIYFYSENIFPPAILIVQQIEKYNVSESPLKKFADFTKFMADLIIKKMV